MPWRWFVLFDALQRGPQDVLVGWPLRTDQGELGSAAARPGGVLTAREHVVTGGSCLELKRLRPLRQQLVKIIIAWSTEMHQFNVAIQNGSVAAQRG